MQPMKINLKRLKERLARLNEHGALPGGGVCRLALSDQDKAGRDLVVSWMEEIGLEVLIDRDLTDRAIAFMQRQAEADKPFFVYYPQTFPHVPLFASKDFKDTSKRGLYGVSTIVSLIIGFLFGSFVVMMVKQSKNLVQELLPM